MYSFEGEFRRRPQQNLAGASAYQNLSRDALLKKAHQERIKREVSLMLKLKYTFICIVNIITSDF